MMLAILMLAILKAANVNETVFYSALLHLWMT